MLQNISKKDSKANTSNKYLYTITEVTMMLNYLNKLLLDRNWQTFKKDKDGLKFAQWINANVTPNFLEAPNIEDKGEKNQQ